MGWQAGRDPKVPGWDPQGSVNICLIFKPKNLVTEQFFFFFSFSFFFRVYASVIVLFDWSAFMDRPGLDVALAQQVYHQKVLYKGKGSIAQIGANDNLAFHRRKGGVKGIFCQISRKQKKGREKK